MVFNMIAAGGTLTTGSTATASSQFIDVVLPRKPKMFVGVQGSDLIASSRLAYAVLDESTGTYQSAFQRNASGSSVSWIDTSATTTWTESTKTLHIRVTYASSIITVTYASVG